MMNMSSGICCAFVAVPAHSPPLPVPVADATKVPTELPPIDPLDAPPPPLLLAVPVAFVFDPLLVAFEPPALLPLALLLLPHEAATTTEEIASDAIRPAL